MTFEEIATQAFVKNGIVAPGEPLSAELGQLALNDGNLLLDEMNIRSVMIYTTSILSFPLTARTLPTYWYEIGPTAADFVTARPNRIERANLIWTSVDPPVRIPIAIVDDLQWSDQPVPKIASNVPNTLYNDGGFPNSKLYLWPYPNTTGNELELFVWNVISQFVAITDTFAFPPGFANAFMLTLAERTCEGFRAIPDSLKASAAKARSYFATLNSASPKMTTTDSGMPGHRTASGNVFNGWPSR